MSRCQHVLLVLALAITLAAIRLKCLYFVDVYVLNKLGYIQDSDENFVLDKSIASNLVIAV